MAWLRNLNSSLARNPLRIGRIRIHPLFLLLFLLAAKYGMWRQFCVLFVLVSLHELGHAAVANQLGYEVEEVSLLPFGGVARLGYVNIGFRPRHEALIAIAGPCVNLLVGLLAWGCAVIGVWSWDFYKMVLEYNIWIAVFNLLPGLPLDGGRILRAARSRWLGYEAATLEAYRVALVLSGVLLLLGGVSMWTGQPHVGALILGLFLGVSAWSGQRAARLETVRFLDAKRRTAERTTEPVRALSTPMYTSVRDVVRQFAPDRYHMVYVRDEDNCILAVLEEWEILDAVFQGHWLVSMESLVTRPH